MKNEFRYFFRKLTDFLFRRWTAPLLFARLGVILTTFSAGASWILSLKYKGSYGLLELGYHSSTTPGLIVFVCFFIGITTFLICLVWEIVRDRNEMRLLEKRKTIVIEQRGLLDTKDQSLAEHIKQTKKVFVDLVLVDIRERLIDNVVTRPDIALEKVLNLSLTLKEKTNSHSVSDIVIVYGGIMPVPFTFVTGYLLDDESKIEVYDWDRDESAWRELSDEDDGQSFEIERVNYGNEKSAVVAVSMSYPVDRVAINTSLPSVPQHHLKLRDKNRNNHWSKQKQDRLAGEFFEYCKQLQDDGVEHIHLVLAAQNSVAFRFGQYYDKRNLPPITVYQYERSNAMKYPWAINISQEPGIKPSLKEIYKAKVA